MKVALVSAVLSLSAIAVGQSLTGLPSCAQTVAINSPTTSGCTSLECICQNVISLQPMIDSSCSDTDQQTACTWANTACATYGISLSCDGSSSVTTTSTTSSLATETTDGSSTLTDMVNTSAVDPSTETTTGAASGSTSVPSTMMTSTMAMNMTTTCTYGWNSTQILHSSTKSMSSKTSSGVTSQYTGAASAAVDKRAGVVGTVIGAALVFAFF